MDAVELSRWTRFAAKGGIGKCTAIFDCVAESSEDLMFLKGDEITVLLQISETLYLGYCEGVVGRFQGKDVQIHSRLKKPVMTKRSSVTASSSSHHSSQMHTASPSPTVGIKTPSPMPHATSPPPSNPPTYSLHRQAVTQTSPRGSTNGVSAISRSPASPSNSIDQDVKIIPSARSPPSDSPYRLSPRTDNPRTLSDVSPVLDSSAASAPSVPVVPPLRFTEHEVANFNDPTPTRHSESVSVSSRVSITSSSPPDVQSVQRSSSTLQNNATSSGPTPSGSGSSVAYVQPQAPDPLPSIPTHQSESDETHLDTSVSTQLDTSATSRFSLALSDGEVGIGLSLLQGLVDHSDYDDSSDEDSDREKNATTTHQKWADGGSGYQKEKAGSDASNKLPRSERRDSVSSSDSSRYSAHHPDQHRRYSTASSDSEVDRLGYEDTETGHETLDDHKHESEHGSDSVRGASPDQTTQRVHPANPSSFSPQEMTFPPVAPLSPSRPRSKTAREDGVTHYAFPAPPTHTPAHSLTQEQLYSLQELERERRPSLATSAASTGTSDWEGAGDIYDDYRYSRFSMAPPSPSVSAHSGSYSKASGRRMSAASRRMSMGSSRRMSASSSKMGHAVLEGDYPAFVDNPEARSRMDSVNSRPSVDSHAQRRPSQDGTKSIPDVRRTSSRDVPSINASNVPVVPALQSPTVPHLDAGRLGIRETRRHTRSESLGGSESDASIYTQSSIGQGAVHSPMSDHFEPSITSQPKASLRGSVVANEVLTNPQDSSSRTPGVTTPLNVKSSPSRVMGSSSGVKGDHATEAPLASPPLEAGSSSAITKPDSALKGAVSNIGVSNPSTIIGAASALRQRLETNNQSVPPPLLSGNNTLDDGDRTERRIVIEDDDEVSYPMPSSPIVDSPGKDSSFSTFGTDSPERSQTIKLQGRQTRFTVVNRTPSPDQEPEKTNEAIPAEVPSEWKEPEKNGFLTVNSNTPQVPTQSPTPPPAAHLRPSLSELRGGQIADPLNPGQRRSLFLPHPNAPKAPETHSPGPMYITQQQPLVPPTQTIQGGAIHVIKMLLASSGRPGMNNRNGGRGPTIYGRTTEDLASATGPVLMIFSVDPPPATAPPGSPQRMVVNNTAVETSMPTRVSTPRSAEIISTTQTVVEHRVGDGERPISLDHKVGGVIPRANFFPKAGGARPRSRSFSGFNSTTTEIPLPVQRSREEGAEASETLSAMDVKRSLASPDSSLAALQLTNRKSTSKTSSLRSSSSSPLLSSNNLGLNSANLRATKLPSSPLAASFTSPSPVPSSPTTSTSNFTVQRSSNLMRTNVVESPAMRPTPLSQGMLPGENNFTQPPTSPRRPSKEHEHNTTPIKHHTAVDSDVTSVHSTRSNAMSPPPHVARHNSLRTKLSLPNLRRNNRPDGTASPALGNLNMDGGDTVQVQDMDFELVRPSMSQLQASRSSEDSTVLGRDGFNVVKPEFSSHRSASPAVSFGDPRSPTTVTEHLPSGSSPQPVRLASSSTATESESSVDAHRQREQKWMAVMSSVPPSQSKKNKKIKKLLLEGVPSSVRYLVWMHLTDAKAKCVPGIYTQLGTRGRVPASPIIEKDIQRCFANHQLLQNTQGSILNLLQAYLTMVPDVQYATGLTLIVGQLLLLAPEEDAFWIFVSIMDSYLRPYFSNTSQMEVDASLVNRALESIDSSLAKKLFSDLSVSPAALYRPWFTSLFVGSLPVDYLNRVWDIFLLDGVPFLFRAALALLSCHRRHILDMTSEESLFACLHSSPPALPPTPEAFISLALSVKLKDDDIRKQRIKMEAQVKRHTQAPRLGPTPATISLPRS